MMARVLLSAVLFLTASCSAHRPVAHAPVARAPASASASAPPVPAAGPPVETEKPRFDEAPDARPGYWMRPGYDVRDPVLSHHGQWIAFVTNVHVPDGGEATNLESFDPKLYAAYERALHENEARDLHFRDPVIVVIDASTGAETRKIGNAADFAISPDDKKIAYVLLAKRTPTIRVVDVADGSERAFTVTEGNVLGVAYLRDGALVYREQDLLTRGDDGETLEPAERLVHLDMATDKRTVLFRAKGDGALAEFAACSGHVRVLVDDQKRKRGEGRFRVLEVDRGVRVLTDFGDCHGCAYRPVPWPNRTPLCRRDYVDKKLGDTEPSNVIDVATDDGRRRVVMQPLDISNETLEQVLTVKSGAWLDEKLFIGISIPGFATWSGDGRHVAVTYSALGTVRSHVYQSYLRWWTVPSNAK